MPFSIIHGDITKCRVDAVVNAANTGLKAGGGVCGAIFAAAGADRLQAACDLIHGCATGEAVVTWGYDLPAKYIIHTVGPIWQGGSAGERDQLASCYRSSLVLAVRHHCSSVAFPLISSGIYGYPKVEALTVATETIRAFLMEQDGEELTVTLVVYDMGSFRVSQERYQAVCSYIDTHYIATRHFLRTEQEKPFWPQSPGVLESKEMEGDPFSDIFQIFQPG